MKHKVPYKFKFGRPIKRPVGRPPRKNPSTFIDGDELYRINVMLPRWMVEYLRKTAAKMEDYTISGLVRTAVQKLAKDLEGVRDDDHRKYGVKIPVVKPKKIRSFHT